MLVTWAVCVSSGRSPFSEVIFMCVQLVMAKPAWSQCPPSALRLGMGENGLGAGLSYSLGWSWEPGEVPAGAGLGGGEGSVTFDAE